MQQTSFHPDLYRLDSTPIPEGADEIRLFTVVRNEILRLPYFLDYYRQLGVTRFFVISNNSDDETDSFLLSQPDVHTFHTKASYATTRAGLDWINPLMTHYGAGRWTICCDADELFVYPRCEQLKLPQLASWLDRNGYQGVYTLMLDMYSDRPISQLDYHRGQDFRTACAYFDKDYHFVSRLGLPGKAPFPPLEPIGGPRLRLCFPEQNTPSLLPRLQVKLMRRVLRLAHKFGLLKQFTPPTPATQAFKIPFVKWQQGYGLITSHRMNPIALAPLTGALLHFKYFQDFGARVQDAVTRLNHYDGSVEYKRYAELLTQNPQLALTYSGSAKYQGSEDLVRLGLIKDNPGWKMAS